MTLTRRSFFAALAALPFVQRLKAGVSPPLDVPLTQGELDQCFMDAVSAMLDNPCEYSKDGPSEMVWSRGYNSCPDSNIWNATGPKPFDIGGRRVQRVIGSVAPPDPEPEDPFYKEIGEALRNGWMDASNESPSFYSEGGHRRPYPRLARDENMSLGWQSGWTPYGGAAQ